MNFVLKIIVLVLNSITNAIDFLYNYRVVYVIGGFFATRKFKKAKNLHKYAVLIAARNEQSVIGNLIESINEQDYPKELVDIFVVADNCTDDTAKIVRKYGAKCYERFDDKNKTKGFALQFLVECIRKDYGIEAYDGYFVFDADNLLKKNYISKMNDSFDAGEKIVTSYRNTKNFDDNWISASYAIHWLRTIRSEHRMRSVLHLATRIQGTGFLFANELIKDGWNYTSLTEDRAFCADAVVKGYKISYNDEAEFYDEQPVSIRIAMRQRIRWAKGHLQAFTELSGKMASHIFVTHGMANKEDAKGTKRKRFWRNIKFRFMSFDMLTVIFPRSLVGAIKKALVLILRIAMVICTGAFFGIDYATTFLKKMFSIFGWHEINCGKSSIVAWLIICAFAYSVNTYIKAIFAATYIFIIEHKRIKHITLCKKVWYCLTFPIFDAIGKLSMCIALFKKVEWNPIPHNSSIKISEVFDAATAKKQ